MVMEFFLAIWLLLGLMLVVSTRSVWMLDKLEKDLLNGIQLRVMKLIVLQLPPAFTIKNLATEVIFIKEVFK